MIRKIYYLMTSLIVISMLLSACGNAATATKAPATAAPATAAPATAAPATAAPATATQAPAATQAPVTITWWQLSGNDAQVKAWGDIIAAFQTAHPGITIKLSTRSIDDQKTALRTAEGTDAFPDIYFMWSGLGLGGEFVNAGASAPLDTYYTKYGWDKTLSAPALAAAKQYGDGHFHGVMSEIHGQVLYYRKDLFQKAGITAAPTTYDELIADNDKLVAIGVAPIEFGGTVNWHVMRLLDNLLETKCGTATHDQLKAMKVSWATTSCVTDAFTALKLWSDKYLNKGFMGIDNTASGQLLYTGKAAMALEGDWFVGQLQTDKQDLSNYGMFLFPTGTGRLYSFAQGNYIGANSKHKDEAAAFLDYFVSADVQSKYLGTFGSISVNQTVTAPANQQPLDAQWVKIFGAATGSFQNSDQAFPLDVTTEYWRIQNLVATDALDPAKAGAQFQKFIDNRKP